MDPAAPDERDVAGEVTRVRGPGVGGEPTLHGEPGVVLGEHLVETVGIHARRAQVDIPGYSPATNRRASSSPMMLFASHNDPAATSPSTAANGTRSTDIARSSAFTPRGPSTASRSSAQ